MIPYYILCVFLLLSALLEVGINNKLIKYRIFLYLAFVLICFSALRYDVGNDYRSYFSIFEGINKVNENGFHIILNSFRLLSKEIGFYIFITLLSLITIGSAIKFIERYSKYPLLSLFIFFCFGQYLLLTFNLLRQAVVIYVFLGFFINFAINRNWVKYCIGICLLSFFFHSTALILLPFYFFTREIKIKIRLLIIVAFIFSQSIFTYLIENSPYAIYALMDSYSADVTILQYFLLVVSGLFFVNFIFAHRRGEYFSRTTTFFENLNFVTLLFCISMVMFANTPLMQVASRLSFYTTPIYIVLIPNYIYKLKIASNRNIFRYGVIIMYFVIFFVAINTNGEEQHTVPYKTIFEVTK